MTNNSKQKNIIEEIDVKELFYKILRKWYIFIISVIICISLGVYYIYSTAPTMNTYSTILIKQENGLGGLGNMDFGIGSNFMNSNSKKIDDEIEILKSKNSIQQMIYDLSLQTKVFYTKRLGSQYEMFNNEPLVIVYPENFLNSLKGTMLIKVKKRSDKTWTIKFKHKLGYTNTKEKYTLDNLDKSITTQWGEFNFIEEPSRIDKDYENYEITYQIAPTKSRIEEYSQVIVATKLNKNSNTIKVTTSSTNAKKNEAIVNKIIDLYNQSALSDKNKTSLQLSDFITERIKLLNDELKVIEDKVEIYRRDKNIANISEQSRVAIESVSEYDKRMTEIEMQINTLTFISDFITKSEEMSLIPSNVGIQDPTLSALIVNYNNQVMEYLRLSRSTNEENPFVSQLKNKIILSRNNILQTLNNVKEGIILQKDELTKRNNTIASQIQDIPTIEKEYIAIAREQGVKRNLYLFLLQKREETQLVLSSNTNNSKIIDRGYTTENPISPNKKIILLISIFFAGIISIIYIYIDSIINNKIENKAMLKKITQIPIISSISHDSSSNKVIMTENNNSSSAEMIRVLRNNIKFILKKENDKVILFTSSISGEGKSFIATNLALSLALIDKKVALLGLDIRKPMLAKYLNLKEKIGITNYLIDSNYTIEDICQSNIYNNGLDVYAAGAIPPNPSELLNNPRLQHLLNELKSKYDYIIIDAAPVGLTGDTFIINDLCDATLYVCRYKYTPIEHIKNLNTISEDKMLKNISLILNDIPESQTYGYGYGYTKK